LFEANKTEIIVVERLIQGCTTQQWGIELRSWDGVDPRPCCRQ